MTQGKRRALLGRIAEFGWFVQQGEPAATQALAMLLEDRIFKESLLGHLEDVIGVRLSRVVVFVPEVIHQDGGRPDLEGQDAEGRPVLVVEAKFGAPMSSAQVRSYLIDQQLQLGASVRGAFVLLVPKARVGEAERVVEAALQELKDQDFHIVSIEAAVVTWDEWIKVWDEAVRERPDGGALVGDLEQLRAMCMTLGGLVIPPLDEAAFGSAWRERKEDLRQIVDEVTRRFFALGERYPMQNEPGYEPFRYLPGGDAEPGVACSVGIGTQFADEGASPFWLRYHKGTPGFSLVRARLHASSFAPDIRTDGHHIWLPLAASPDAAGPELVEQLVAQVNEILAASSSGRPSARDVLRDSAPNRPPPSNPDARV